MRKYVRLVKNEECPDNGYRGMYFLNKICNNCNMSWADENNR